LVNEQLQRMDKSGNIAPQNEVFDHWGKRIFKIVIPGSPTNGT